jgi:hypothetical protein
MKKWDANCWQKMVLFEEMLYLLMLYLHRYLKFC